MQKFAELPGFSLVCQQSTGSDCSTTFAPNWLSAVWICSRYPSWKLSCTFGFL